MWTRARFWMVRALPRSAAAGAQRVPPQCRSSFRSTCQLLTSSLPCAPPRPPFPPPRARFAEVGDVLAEAEVLCTAVLESRVFDRLYSLIKCVGAPVWL